MSNPETPAPTPSPSPEAPPAAAPEPHPEPTALAPQPPPTEGTAQAAPAAAEGAEAPAVEGAPHEAAGAAPEGEAKKRKRRRRRRRKGGQSTVPPGDGAAASAAPPPEPGASEEHEPSKTEEQPKGAEGGPHEKAEPGKAGKKKRPRKREHAPRERPAFSVGDVVFGKITEMTDEAIFVDVAGKGRGIFDRRELDLPDEPPEEEARSEPEPELHAVAEEPAPGESPAETAAAAGAAPAAGEAEPTPSQKATALQSAVPEGFSEAPTEPGTPFPAAAIEQHTQRRIVKAKALVEAEAKEREAAAAPLADAEPSAPAEGAAAETPDAQGEAAAVPTEVAAASPEAAAAPAAPEGDKPAAPHPPVYAPPVVLEIGAHFVGLVHNDGARGGLIVLTRHPRRVTKAKLAAVQSFKEKTTVTGLVTGVVKGGVEVDVEGLRAFAPGSHMDLRLGADMHPFIGKRLDFLVTQYGKRGRDVVLSRKPMLEAQARAARDEAIGKLQVGSVVEGTVRSVVPFGAFLDIGGVEGLVPLPEMSHNRADTPSDVFKPGAKVPVRIIKVDDKGKVWLSRKQALPDPWAELTKKYAVGSRHTGKVVRLQPFGAFVELENGIDGLIHLADLSLKRIEHPSDVVKVGDAIEVVVASIDGGAHKIALHPAPTGPAADEPRQKVALHKAVKCAVVAVETGGLLVRILGATGRHARGFITAAATGTPRGTELRKPFPPGTQLEAKVVELDPKRGEVKLSIKALREETERTAYQQYRAQVNREAKFGTFADLLAKKTQK